MKPDWDKLMRNWNKGERLKTSLIADVNCEDETSKPLCETHGVDGFPTLKWGDPSFLEDYDGERDFKSLKKFAFANLKPKCSPVNIDLCDEQKKADIAKYQAMSPEDLEAAIEEKTAVIEAKKEKIREKEEKLEEKFEEVKKLKGRGNKYNEELKKWSKKQEKLKKEKKDTNQAAIDSGLSLMQAVADSLKAAGKTEL